MTSLNGRRILVVEDEPIIAMTIEDILIELGAEVVGPATTLEGAIDQAETGQFDAAMLDLNLNGRRSDPVAKTLAARAIPFVFSTGYTSASSEDWAHIEVLSKPYRPDQVAAALVRAIGEAQE